MRFLLHLLACVAVGFCVGLAQRYGGRGAGWCATGASIAAGVAVLTAMASSGRSGR